MGNSVCSSFCKSLRREGLKYDQVVEEGHKNAPTKVLQVNNNNNNSPVSSAKKDGIELLKRLKNKDNNIKAENEELFVISGDHNE